jgi:predicted peroxiredoxin
MTELLEKHIEKCILEIDTDDIEIAKKELLDKFRAMKMDEIIKDFKPCDRILYCSRPKLKELLKNTMYNLKQFYREVSWNIYMPINKTKNIEDYIEDIIESGVKIIVDKQKGL